MIKPTEINLGGTKEPLFCDLSVLERLQDEFGSLNEFEMKLIGIRYIRDAEGKYIYDDDGTPKVETVEPNIRAISIALVEMVNEGRAVLAHQRGAVWEPVDDIDVVASCTVPYQMLAPLLHREYKRCFETKKPIATERKPRTKKKTS